MKSAQVAYPHAPQLIPAASLPVAPISTQASPAAIFAASRRKNLYASLVSPYAFIAATSFFICAFVSTAMTIESCPLPFGAVRAASAMSPATIATASFSAVIHRVWESSGQ